MVVNVKHDPIISTVRNDVGKVFEELFREVSLNLDTSTVVGKKVKVDLDVKGT